MLYLLSPAALDPPPRSFLPHRSTIKRLTVDRWWRSFQEEDVNSGAEGTRFKRRSADKRVLSPPDMEVKIITADPRVNRSWNLLLLSWLHILVTPLHEPPFSLLSSGAVWRVVNSQVSPTVRNQSVIFQGINLSFESSSAVFLLINISWNLMVNRSFSGLDV